MTTRLEPVWRTVPVEPTEAMLVNGREALMPLVRLNSYGPLIGVWKDMLAAAPAPDGMREAIAGPAAWLNRWAAHVGNCKGGTECTCGLWLAQFEMEKALAIIAKGEGR